MKILKTYTIERNAIERIGKEQGFKDIYLDYKSEIPEKFSDVIIEIENKKMYIRPIKGNGYCGRCCLNKTEYACSQLCEDMETEFFNNKYNVNFEEVPLYEVLFGKEL